MKIYKPHRLGWEILYRAEDWVSNHLEDCKVFVNQVDWVTEGEQLFFSLEEALQASIGRMTHAHSILLIHTLNVNCESNKDLLKGKRLLPNSTSYYGKNGSSFELLKTVHY
jgi:hypothetical protein